MYTLGPKGDPCRIPRKSDNNDKVVSTEMERRNKMIENWRMNGLSKPVATSDSADIQRNTSRIENKHLGVKQSRSLGLMERRFDGNSRNVQSDVKDRVRKHHASEKIRRSTSSKFKNEGMESKQGHHKANVYRSDKEHPDNLHFIDAFDFSGEQNTRVDKEGKQPRKTTLNDSHKGSEDSSLSNKSRSNSNRMSDDSRTSKVVRQDSTGVLKRHKELVRRSSASPETNSNELQSPKKRKSSSKRKEIHKKQPTFYGLSGKDLALPLSTSEIRVKSDKRKIPQRGIGTGIITSNFTVLETGEGIDNGDRRGIYTYYLSRSFAFYKLINAHVKTPYMI